LTFFALNFYCTQLRFVQLSNKAYDDDDDDDDRIKKIMRFVLYPIVNSSVPRISFGGGYKFN